MDIFTVAFFGHRYIDLFSQAESGVEKYIKDLLINYEYVDFLVGRDGEFDQIVSSTVKRMKRAVRDDNSSLIWVLPYPKAEYEKNEDNFYEYYDEIEICEESSRAHFKSAIQIRNRYMVDRADLVICYIDHENGGAYQTVKYAEKQGKKIIKIANESE